MAARASSSFKIKGWDEAPYAEIEGGGKLTKASVTAEFSGDIAGESSVEWLMCYRPDQTADFVGLQRIVGTLGGRSGSFVLAHPAGTFTAPRRGARSRWWRAPAPVSSAGCAAAGSSRRRTAASRRSSSTTSWTEPRWARGTQAARQDRRPPGRAVARGGGPQRRRRDRRVRPGRDGGYRAVRRSITSSTIPRSTCSAGCSASAIRRGPARRPARGRRLRDAQAGRRRALAVGSPDRLRPPAARRVRRQGRRPRGGAGRSRPAGARLPGRAALAGAGGPDPRPGRDALDVPLLRHRRLCREQGRCPVANAARERYGLK